MAQIVIVSIIQRFMLGTLHDPIYSSKEPYEKSIVAKIPSL